MNLVLFEDDRASLLYPVTVARPAYEIGCGGERLVELLRPLGHAMRFVVRAHLRSTIEQDAAASAPRRANEGEVLVNARLVPSATTLGALERVIADARPGIVWSDNALQGQQVAIAMLPAGHAALASEAGPVEVASYLAGLNLDRLEPRLPLFHYAHDIVRYHLSIMRENLDRRLAGGDYREIADGVFARGEARLGEYVTTDTQVGPIVLDDGASVGPYCYLSGPVYLAHGARVIEHAALKDCVALGHTTKVGGEVEGSVIEPYTNKQHHGFLGHSYLGSWVNLGAGTCNSDLKNTYGQVNMEYFGQKVATGMQFLGCLVGDYAKTAINTGIFTGKTIGACSMVYGFVTTNVPSFVNYARSFGQVTEAPVEVMIAAQARMFARRNVEQRPSDIQLLQDMYELTRHERQIAGEPLAL